MDNDYTVARPYAVSAFEIAKSANLLDKWQDFLDYLTEITAVSDFKVILLANRHNATELLISLTKEAGYDDKEYTNFIKIVAENNRLTSFSSILHLFKKAREEFDLPTPVTVISAFSLTKKQLNKIADTLTKKLDHKVDLKIEIDKSIIGGIIIKSELGDFNSSVKQLLLSLEKNISK